MGHRYWISVQYTLEVRVLQHCVNTIDTNMEGGLRKKGVQ